MFAMFFEFVIVAFFLNIFSRVINLLLTGLVKDRYERISALDLFYGPRCGFSVDLAG